VPSARRSCRTAFGVRVTLRVIVRTGLGLALGPEIPRPVPGFLRPAVCPGSRHGQEQRSSVHRVFLPSAAEEAEGPRGLFQDPVDNAAGPKAGAAGRSAAAVTHPPGEAVAEAALLPAGDGAGTAVADGGDGGPGKAISKEHDDMGAEAEFGLGGL
jgi:hypothetical protein